MAMSPRLFTVTGTLTFFLSLALTGCDNGKSPAASIEQAAVGNYSAALSNDGHHALIGSINHGGSLWDLQQDERLYDWNHKKGEFTNIVACAFSPDGNYAITADHQTLVLWSTTDGKAMTYWSAPSDVLAVTLTTNGNYALLGLGDYTAALFNVKQGGVQRIFRHQDRVGSVSMSEDGHLALTGSEDQTAVLWNVDTGEALQRWQQDDDIVTVALSADGSKAFTVAKYDSAVLWDTSTGKKLGALPLRASAVKRGLAFTSARFSHDGNYLLTGDADRQVQLWDANTLQQIDLWTVPKRSLMKPTSAAVLAVAFADNDRTFYAVTSNGFTHRLRR